MRSFSFTKLSDSVLNGLCTLGSEDKERVTLAYPPDFPREVFGKYKDVSNLLNLLFAWTVMDRRIERSDFSWAARSESEDGMVIEGRVVIHPSESCSAEEISFRALTEKPVFGHLLSALQGRVVEETRHSLMFVLQFDKPPSGAPLELDSMLKLVGDRELCGALIEHYLATAPSLISGIETALSQDDSQTVHRLAHTIKGGALNIHAPALRKAALDLENDAKAKRLNNVNFHLEKIRREFLTVSEYYAIFIKERI